MKDLYLIYVNYVGVDYKFNHIYEFIFSDTTQNIDGEDWDYYPASGRPLPPNNIFIKKVGRLESKLKLDVIQKSDSFAVWDAVDGVIALAWENVDDNLTTYPENRVYFRFGDTETEVVEKLYNKELILAFGKQNEKQLE